MAVKNADEFLDGKGRMSPMRRSPSYGRRWRRESVAADNRGGCWTTQKAAWALEPTRLWMTYLRSAA